MTLNLNQLDDLSVVASGLTDIEYREDVEVSKSNMPKPLTQRLERQLLNPRP